MKRMSAALGALFLLLALGIGVASCGSSNSMSAPSSGTTVNIVGISGPAAFSPNPVSVPSGMTLTWHNTSGTTHHLVQDGGGFDTGDISAGSTTMPIMINSTAGMTYHCMIHPTMTGGINTSSTGTPPPGGGYSTAR
jgi:plastocyanin